MTAEPQALDDLRVLEVSDLKGQLCGKLLADLGAGVLRIEPPEGSEPRRVGPFHGDRHDVNGSLHFWHYNTSKRSLTLDLAAAEGREIFRRLAVSADVVIETREPGEMARLGLAYDDLRADNPGLIYCSITPYGQTGPWAHYKASDLTLMASGGEMGVCGYDPIDDPEDTPIAPGGGNAWHLGDNYAFIAILLALRARDRHGAGDYIDLSVHDAVSVCTEGAFPDYIMVGEDRLRQTGRHAVVVRSPPVQFLCKDGRYANCFLPRLTLAEFFGLLEWLDEYDLGGDLKEDRFLDPDVLRANIGVLLSAIKGLCERLTSDEIYHGGQGRGLPWTIVRAPSDIPDDPHLGDRGFFVEIEHPELGRSFTYPGAPYIMHRTPWRIRSRAPLLGEDNFAVYHDELGMSVEQLDALSRAGVI